MGTIGSSDTEIDLKYLVLAMENKVAQLDKDMARNTQSVSELQATAIRTDERIVVIQKYLNDMSADIRTVRNSILGAIVAATLIGIVGLATAQLNSNKSLQNPVNPIIQLN